MNKFPGFTSTETFTQIPDSYFHLLKEIKDVDELKVTLYAIWRIEHMEGNIRALSEVDFEAKLLGLSNNEIQNGLKKCVERAILLKAEYKDNALYFLNSPRGRLSAKTFANGQLKKSSKPNPAPRPTSNTFKLYEENIGPLTPLIADMLREAENNYPSIWLEEAFQIAVSRNIRNWKYIESILNRWKEKGKDGRKDQQDSVQSTGRYTDSEFSEFIKRD